MDDEQKDSPNEVQETDASEEHPVLEIEVEAHRTLDSEGADPGVVVTLGCEAWAVVR